MGLSMPLPRQNAWNGVELPKSSALELKLPDPSALLEEYKEYSPLLKEFIPDWESYGADYDRELMWAQAFVNCEMGIHNTSKLDIVKNTLLCAANYFKTGVCYYAGLTLGYFNDYDGNTSGNPDLDPFIAGLQIGQMRPYEKEELKYFLEENEGLDDLLKRRFLEDTLYHPEIVPRAFAHLLFDKDGKLNCVDRDLLLPVEYKNQAYFFTEGVITKHRIFSAEKAAEFAQNPKVRTCVLEREYRTSHLPTKCYVVFENSILKMNQRPVSLAN